MFSFEYRQGEGIVVKEYPEWYTKQSGVGVHFEFLYADWEELIEGVEAFKEEYQDQKEAADHRLSVEQSALESIANIIAERDNDIDMLQQLDALRIEIEARLHEAQADVAKYEEALVRIDEWLEENADELGEDE